MTEEEVVKVAAMVKVTIIAGIRKAIQNGGSINKALDRFEYSTFAMKDDELILIPSKRNKKT